MCVCEPAEIDGYRYIEWVALVFRDCIYSPTDILSFWLGLVQIGLWCICLFPQLWKNFVNKQVDALSPIFLMFWFTGDAFNLLGCLLTDQLPTQTYTAIYFCFIDVFTLSQYIYYRKIRKFLLKEKEISKKNQAEKIEQTEKLIDQEENIENNQIQEGDETNSNRKNSQKLLAIPFVFVILFFTSFGTMTEQQYNIGSSGRHLLESSDPPLCNEPHPLPQGLIYFGYFIAWSSGLIYWLSRIPQIIKNYKRKSVEGLSIWMFFLTLSANLCYGFQILLRLPTIDSSFYGSTLPYIMGSLGTAVWDCTIFYQAHYYSKYRSYSSVDDQL